MARLGVIGIVVEDKGAVLSVQRILSEFSDVIEGRMGIPHKEDGIAVISLIVKGEVERLSALTGKLGRIAGISVKSALTNVEV